MSELLAIGVSHKTAPVEVRERLALTQTRAPEFMRELRATEEVHEAVAISTCNRTELYLVVGDPVEAESTVLTMLARQAEIRPTELTGAIYSHRNCEAARHLYRVVSGLDSMIVGEAQVQGQVKRAYEAALDQDTTGTLTNRLFTAALATGKRVRAETAIGKLQLSIPSVAVALAKERIGDLSGHEVVIIGTGETGELTARALADSGAEAVFVASRRRDRAISLAQRYHGSSVPFDELPEVLDRADIVVAATASPHLLLEAEEVAEVMRSRDGRPLLLIDLAVPRDIEAMCGRWTGSRSSTSTTCRRSPSATGAYDRRRPRAPRGSSRRRSSSSPPGSAALEVLPTVAAMRAQAAEIAANVLAENDGKWERADRPRPRAGRRDRPHDRQPPAARADAADARDARRPRARADGAGP